MGHGFELSGRREALQADHKSSPQEHSPSDHSQSGASLASRPSDDASPAGTSTAKTLHKHSCVVCATRKIRCDRREPCSNCIRSKSTCLFRAPAPPRRRKKGAAQNDILERLKHAENLLAVRSETSEPRSLNNLMFRVADLNLEKRGQLLNASESSQYLDNSMWIWLNDELRDIRAVVEEEADDDALSTYGSVPSIVEDESFSSTAFGGSSSSRSMVDHHPSPVHVMQMWQLYLSQCHVLTKILHAPTVQDMIIEATGHLDQISRSLEALMFCMYYVVAISTNDEDCKVRFQESRSVLVSRYRMAAQASLLRADYMNSHNIQVLQAYVLYLLGTRTGTQPAAMWLMAGIAIRMGHRIGLHRDGETLGLPIFETELRRRLWWEIIFFDARMAQLSGTGGITLGRGVQYIKPRNVNDSDLYPGMEIPPMEHDNITEMIHPMIRAEIGFFLTSFPTTGTFDGSWQGVAHSTIPVAEKDRLIDELDLRLKEKYLDKLDPLIPWHLLARCMALSASRTIRFMAHHPRQYAESMVVDAQEERLLFDCACSVVENMLFAFTEPSLKRFQYYTRMHFQYLALVYLIRMLKRHTVDAEAERGWRILDGVCTLEPPLLPEAPQVLQLAVEGLILIAWEARSSANPHGKEPTYISSMRKSREARMGIKKSMLAGLGHSVFARSSPASRISDSISPMRPMSEGSTAFSAATVLQPASSGDQFPIHPLDWDGWDDFMDEGNLEGFGIPFDTDSLLAGSV